MTQDEINKLVDANNISELKKQFNYDVITTRHILLGLLHAIETRNETAALAIIDAFGDQYSSFSAALTKAIHSNITSVVERLLINLKTIHEVSHDSVYRLLLHICKNNDLDILRLYLKNHAIKNTLKNANTGNSVFMEALKDAVNNGFEFFNLFLSHLQDSFRDTDLYEVWEIANRHNHKAITTRLEQIPEVQAYIVEHSFRSAIHDNALDKVEEIFNSQPISKKVIIRSINDVLINSATKITKARQACLAGNLHKFSAHNAEKTELTIHWLIEKLPDLENREAYDLFLTAMHYDHIVLFEKLCSKHGVWLSTSSNIHELAALSKNPYFLKHLVSQYKSAVENSNALKNAAQTNNEEAIDYLLKNINPSKQQLQDVLLCGHRDIINRYLGDTRFQAAISDMAGMDPMLLAPKLLDLALKGSLELIALLNSHNNIIADLTKTNIQSIILKSIQSENCALLDFLLNFENIANNAHLLDPDYYIGTLSYVKNSDIAATMHAKLCVCKDFDNNVVSPIKDEIAEVLATPSKKHTGYKHKPRY